MPASQRQQRKTDAAKSKPASNSNVWILVVAFAALVSYVLYHSISVYTKDRMYNDFD